MTRTVQPHEIIISLCIFTVLAAGLFGSGYWLGHRNAGDWWNAYDDERIYAMSWLNLANEEGWMDHENPIRINAECRGDSSDWATIRMANQIGYERDIPVFVHGNCLTHEVVDIETTNEPVKSIEDNAGTEFSEPTPIPCPANRPDLHDCMRITGTIANKFTHGRDTVTIPPAKIEEMPPDGYECPEGETFDAGDPRCSKFHHTTAGDRK